MTEADFVDAVKRLSVNSIIAASCAHSERSAQANQELAASTVDEAHKQLGRIIAYVATINPAVLEALAPSRSKD